MKRPFFTLLFVLCSALCATLFVAGCASESVKNSDNPEVIYNASLKFIEKERYLDATEHLNEIRHRFPQSRFAALAELATGDMEFKQENWTEAAASFKVFVELYPNHASAAYAQYQRALSYYNDAPTKIARDQSPAKDSVEACEQLVARYPNTEYATKARKLLVDARRKLAEKEAYIARFYEHREAYPSALKRWENLLKDFSDLQNDEASKQLFAEAAEKTKSLAGKL